MKRKLKIQHLFRECKPNMCLESENLKPGWRVIVWKLWNLSNKTINFLDEFNKEYNQSRGPIIKILSEP